MNDRDAVLASARAKVSEVDTLLVSVLNERARQVDAIYQLKRAHGLARFDQARTDFILAQACAINTGPLTDAELRRLMIPILRFFSEEFQNRGCKDGT